MSRRFSKVLVTGGAGFIGSHSVDALLDKGVEVGVLDNVTTGERSNLGPSLSRVTLHKCDVRDWPAVQQAVSGYQAVLHLAALVSVTRSVENPLLSSSVNVDGTLNLLEASRISGVEKFVFASSSSVYGETGDRTRVESMEPAPVSPYAVSKLAAENYCRVYGGVHGLKTVCLRYFNVYGPRQKPGPYSGVIPTFIESLVRGQSPTIFGDGLQTRDFTYVDDVVSANLLAMDRDLRPGEVFNIASGSEVTINELAALLARLMGKESLEPKHVAPRPGDVRNSRADISKAKSTLGYNPVFSMKEGLGEVIKWQGRQMR